MSLQFDAPDGARRSRRRSIRRVMTPDYFKTMGIPLIEGRTVRRARHPEAPIVGHDRRAHRQAAVAGPKRRSANAAVRPRADETSGIAWMRNRWRRRSRHSRRPRRGLRGRRSYWDYEQSTQDRMVLVARDECRSGRSMSADHRARSASSIPSSRSTTCARSTMCWAVAWPALALMALLVGSFAIVALLFAAIGVYGVMAFGVARQRREFGIRLALGASRRGIAASVLKHGRHARGHRHRGQG